MHAVSYWGMMDFVDEYVKPHDKVLDVGSCSVQGDKCPSYRELNNEWEYIGCDVEAGNNVNVVLSDPYNWVEFEDNYFDCVISGQAFEHIEYPWLTIKEIARVLKPKGYTCIIAPNRCPLHFYPVDTFRYNPDGFDALAKWAGLKKVSTTVADWQWNDNLWCQDTRLIARKP
jgi:SAM-dependent methyltransferase